MATLISQMRAQTLTVTHSQWLDPITGDRCDATVNSDVDYASAVIKVHHKSFYNDILFFPKNMCMVQ